VGRLVLALLLVAAPPALAVRRGDVWVPWWRADRAPARWAAADTVVAGAIRWRPLRSGLEWGELRLAGAGEAWRVRVIAVRLDPARVRLALVSPARRRPGNHWTIDSAPPAAALALNAGQFRGDAPWGWLVRDGAEEAPPGVGPLAAAVVVDSAGPVRIVPPDSIGAERARGPRLAFQSYPALLGGDGDVPEPLRRAGLGVDLTHRDARLALGILRDGRVLVALTRFEGLGGALSNLPFGLTTPEMAAVMGALGCRRAVLLDGGISSQMLIRNAAGETHAWNGLRNVPLGLVALP
jgi:hypothetical protein